jgi:hypothetical protein
MGYLLNQMDKHKKRGMQLALGGTAMLLPGAYVLLLKINYLLLSSANILETLFWKTNRTELILPSIGILLYCASAWEFNEARKCWNLIKDLQKKERSQLVSLVENPE